MRRATLESPLPLVEKYITFLHVGPSIYYSSCLFHRSDFGKMVAREYLRFFEFDKMSLVESLRQFLSCFSLTGESQERERIMVHFSDRYHECNPDVFHNVGESVLESKNLLQDFVTGHRFEYFSLNVVDMLK